MKVLTLYTKVVSHNFYTKAVHKSHSTMELSHKLYESSKGVIAATL